MEQLKRVGTGNRPTKKKTASDVTYVSQEDHNKLVDRVNLISTETVEKSSNYYVTSEIIRIETPTYNYDISDLGNPVTIPIPSGYLPIRIFTYVTNGNINNFLIQDSEQTELFNATPILEGTSVILPKSGLLKPYIPDFILTADKADENPIKLVIECVKSPFI